jgi:HSP20 family protein
MSYPMGRDPYRRAWDPFAEMGRLLAALSNMRTERGWFDDVDVDESERGWTVTARLPGVAPDEVEVEVDGRELCIRGRTADGDRQQSAFNYRLAMPSDVDPDQVDATMDHGLLTVNLPRAGRSARRQISVGRGQVAGEVTSQAGEGSSTEGTGSTGAAGSTASAGTEPS